MPRRRVQDGGVSEAKGGGVRLRRRVLSSIVAVTACAVLLFTVPLAWAMAEVYRRGAVVLLQRDAIWVAAKLGSRPTLGPEALAGLEELSHGVAVGLYTPVGRQVAGDGPPASPVAARAGDGGLHQGIEAGHLAVAAPVIRGRRVAVTVRVWMPWDSVTDRRTRAWLLLASLGTVVVALSAVLAWHLARRVAVPLERLTGIARALGEGDFTVQAPRTRIREADLAGQALAATARRLGAVLERERRFTTAVSHQLRTPLTALVLGLEAAQTAPEGVRREAVATALRRAEHLAETVEELLRLARETHHGGIAVDAALLAERVADRHRAAVLEAGRRLIVRCEDGLAPVRGSEAAITQILGTLLDNALTHGHGEIRLTVADVGAGVAMEVGDDGPGLRAGDEAAFTGRLPGARHGIGLPLARSLAEAEGGRLVLRRAAPRPVFSLLLPVHDPDGDGMRTAVGEGSGSS
ncbi:HAMP domain-containing histidine kinase [Kitasatospora sp. RB6PN24]|uniref:sensor histidine kinase n=1 Tax=Kitasatospora humi TaxID=2893891 RepID=UPI001E4FF8DF|nr:HAMP domain-containing sensor histidine kinase [Kitasatospora humi]MCC9311016.1 HAMP domain-containing histidine kinase [Kitasatospora humi]